MRMRGDDWTVFSVAPIGALLSPLVAVVVLLPLVVTLGWMLSGLWRERRKASRLNLTASTGCQGASRTRPIRGRASPP